MLYGYARPLQGYIRIRNRPCYQTGPGITDIAQKGRKEKLIFH